MHAISLQISLAPSDYLHSLHFIPHQMKTFENQVAEILLTYDSHTSKGRFAVNREENNAKMWAFLEYFSKGNPKIRLLKIDHSAQKTKEIAKRYFNRNSIPAKDWRGGPFYTYFFGLNEAKHDYVLPYYPTNETAMITFNKVFYGHGHRFIYDSDTMSYLLKKVGFKTINSISFGLGSMKELLIDTPHRVFESLYLEATN